MVTGIGHWHRDARARAGGHLLEMVNLAGPPVMTRTLARHFSELQLEDNKEGKQPVPVNLNATSTVRVLVLVVQVQVATGSELLQVRSS